MIYIIYLFLRTSFSSSYVPYALKIGGAVVTVAGQFIVLYLVSGEVGIGSVHIGCTLSLIHISILTMAVDCMREQLLAGQKIQLGDLGDFSISINSIGAESSAAYNPAIHARKLNVNWSAGTRFRNLLEDAVFNLVATRKAARRCV